MTVIAVLTIALVVSSAVEPSGCRAAIASYNSAVSDVSYAVRRYTTCVLDSSGKDDCSSEFRRVKNAQDDFETAVLAYSTECNE